MIMFVYGVAAPMTSAMQPPVRTARPVIPLAVAGGAVSDIVSQYRLISPAAPAMRLRSNAGDIQRAADLRPGLR